MMIAVYSTADGWLYIPFDTNVYIWDRLNERYQTCHRKIENQKIAQQQRAQAQTRQLTYLK